MATVHAILRGGEARRVAGWQLSALASTVDAMGAPRGSYASRLAGGVDDVLARVVEDLAGAARRGLSVVSDSPAWVGGEFVSTAGFHAAERGLRLDAVTAAVVHVAEISVQRMHRLLDERYTGLPPQLAAAPGRQVGLAAVHKRAVGELHTMRRLTTPATLGSIGTSAGQEDVQVFACAAGEQLRAVLDGLFVITACELIAAGQACALRSVDPAPALRRLREDVAAAVPPITVDRPLGGEIGHLATALRQSAPRT